MVRHTDTEMTVMKEDVYTHRSLKTGGTARHTGPRTVRRQREREENLGSNLCCSFCAKGKAR